VDNNLLKQELCLIATHFKHLQEAIIALDVVSIELDKAIELIERATQGIATAPCVQGERVRKTQAAILSKNNGFLFLKKIHRVLKDGAIDDDVFKRFSLEEVLHFKFAPITLCNVEHNFSQLKFLNSNRRKLFIDSSLSKHHITFKGRHANNFDFSSALPFTENGNASPKVRNDLRYTLFDSEF
jgi:hypothetical protein